MPEECLRERIARGDAVVAGVLSGTSADGIDVACARFAAPRGALELRRTIAFETRPFPPELARRLRTALDGAPCDLATTALLHRDLGRAFGEAAREVAQGAGVRPELAGSHGQTVWHHDGVLESGPATLQLGDGCQMAELLGCPVVSDLRQRDVAAGGEGAPLSGYGDRVLFAGAPRPLAILNLGGMANLSWLGRDDSLLAFDTGPAGSLLDSLARQLLGRPCDAGGAVAAAGRADGALVEALLDHPFLAQPPPKSTGRDTFGEDYAQAFLERSGPARPEDALASAVAFVAETVFLGVSRHLPGPPAELLLAGGGVHNRALVAALERRLGPLLPSPPTTTERHGVDPDGREALVFAALAAAHALGVGVTDSDATGARPGRVLGKWSPANPPPQR